MRITLKAVNNELARQGYAARLSKGSGYFYFQGGEATEWLDRTVDVPTISSHGLEEWVWEFRRLKELNGRIMGTAPKKPGPKRRSRAGG